MLLLIAYSPDSERKLNKLGCNNENQLISCDVKEARVPTYEKNFSLQQLINLKTGISLNKILCVRTRQNTFNKIKFSLI